MPTRATVTPFIRTGGSDSECTASRAYELRLLTLSSRVAVYMPSFGPAEISNRFARQNCCCWNFGHDCLREWLPVSLPSLKNGQTAEQTLQRLEHITLH